MSSSEIPQPHDGLIRYTFSSVDNAVSLFKAHLPARLVDVLNWEQFRLENGSYVDEELRRSESDLLYSVPVRETGKGRLLIYLLFEHQSTSDPWLPLRLLGYMLKIWQRQRKENPAAKGLAPVLPLLLSQVEGGWRISRQFADLLLWPDSLRREIEQFQPRFEHLLIDLAKIPNESLQGNPAVRLVQGLLKAVMEDNLLGWVDWAAPQLKAVLPGEFLRVLFIYAVNAETDFDLQQFVARIKSSNVPEAAETIMSIAERIRIESRKQGEQQGLTRGALIGQIQALQRVLKRPQSSAEILEDIPADKLQGMIAELERDLR